MKQLVPDDELWRQIAESITPLQHRRRAPLVKPAKVEEGEPTAPRKARALAAPKPAPKPALAELTHDRLADLDKRTGQKLVRGKLALEGRIDLHGMTQDEAHGRLARFLETGAEEGKRCVLVITGKSGVLKAAVPRWLNGAALRPLVLAIRYAQAKDGGEGALYVLLKRRRDAR